MKTKYLFATVIIVLIILAIIVVYMILAGGRNFSSFQGTKDFKVFFQYPAQWGNLSAKSNTANGWLYLNFNDESTLLAAQDSTKPAYSFDTEVGPYDEILKITDSNSISSFCVGKQNCQVLTNYNQVEYARIIEKSICYSIGEEECPVVTNYYFYNPDSTFSRFVITSADVQGISDYTPKQLDDLVWGLRFIK